MRNKHNEGYTLPLVMVVLLVLAIVAVTIMTTAMNNMLRQQEFIETMEDQYAAQGQIEAVVAQLLQAENADAVATILSPYAEGPLIATGTTHISFKSIYGSVTINCELDLTVVENGENTVTYTSYEIVKGGGT